MLLNSKTAMGLPVRTKSGIQLGKLASFDLDAETGRLTALHVRVRGMVPGLLDDEAIVAWPQVVTMDDKEIVVVDSFATRGVTLAKKDFASPAANFKERSA